MRQRIDPKYAHTILTWAGVFSHKTHSICVILKAGDGLCFRSWELHETNIVVVYIFSVLLIARFTKGYLYGISASVISILLFNWFFTAPYFTFKVNDMTYLITFAIMMVISIVKESTKSGA